MRSEKPKEITIKRILVATVAAVALAAPALAQQPGQQDRPEQSQMNGGAGQGQMDGAPKQGAMNGRAGGQATMSVDQLNGDQIRVLQQALKDQGKSLEVDGKWGPRTQAALREFNRSQNIESGRELNSQTLAALGLDPTAFSSGTTGQGGRSGPGASDPGMSGSGGNQSR